jgi:protein O-mannosyl-transferase
MSRFEDHPDVPDRPLAIPSVATDVTQTSWFTSDRVAGSLVVAFAVLLYLPSAWNGFAYDDNLAIRMDSRIHEFNPWRIVTQPYWIIENLGLYRPLVSLTYAADWALSGGTPAWFHIVNIGWNALACVLVFAFLRVFTSTVAATMGALLFTAHPVHSEAVANIVGRAELMAAVFMLSAMLLWLRRPMLEPLSAPRGLLLLVLFCLALLSKESAVMLPAVLALCDIARGELRLNTVREWLVRHRFMIAGFIVAGVAWLLARHAVLGAVGPRILDPLFDVASTRGERMLTALQAWPEIVRLFFFPRLLMAEYGPPYLEPVLSPSLESMLGAAYLLALVLGGIVAFAKGAGRAAFVLLLVPVMLLPASNLVLFIGVIVAERTLYMPLLALCAAVAFGYDALLTKRARQRAFAVLAMVLVLFTARTLRRIPEWNTTETVLGALWREQPDSFRAHWHFALVARTQGRQAEALTLYARALRVWPYRKSLTFEALTLAAEADLPMARQIGAFAVERWPDDVRLWRIHAAVVLETEGSASALPVIDQALRVAPQDSILLEMRRSAATPPL